MDVIAQNLPVMMAATDENQVITAVNDEMLAVTGFSRAEFVGVASSAFLLPEDQSVLDELAMERETVSETRGVPLRINCKNGNILDIELFNQRSYNDQGVFVSSLNTLVNVTARNNILRSKQQIHESMVESNHVLAEFSRIAAKEMKQPLGMLESFLCMIRAKADAGSKSFQDLKHLDNNLAKINALVEDLLILAEVDQDPEELRQVDLALMIEAAIQALETEIHRTNAEIFVLGTPPLVYITSSQLGIVLHQLLSNALKYRSPERPLVVNIQVQRIKNQIELRLSDNGRGLDEEHCELIFEAFSRVGSHSEHKSTGMGLAICRRVMDQLGGTISATGSPNVGTEFLLSFPYHGDHC